MKDEQRACANDTGLPLDTAAITAALTSAFDELSEASRFVDLVFYAADGNGPRGEALAAGCERATLSLDELRVYLEKIQDTLKGGAQ